MSILKDIERFGLNISGTAFGLCYIYMHLKRLRRSGEENACSLMETEQRVDLSWTTSDTCDTADLNCSVDAEFSNFGKASTNNYYREEDEINNC